MPIAVTKRDGRTRIEGSERLKNGMTMTFYTADDQAPNCVRLFDMRHARSWLAPDGGEPRYDEGNGEPDMGGRGKTYNVSATGAQVRFTGNRRRREMTSRTPAQAEVARRTSGNQMNWSTRGNG